MKKELFYLCNLLKFCILHRETAQHSTEQHSTAQLNNIRLSENKKSLLQAFCLQ